MKDATLSRPVIGVLVAVLTAPWLVAAIATIDPAAGREARTPTSETESTSRPRAASPGRWGRLEYFSVGVPPLQNLAGTGDSQSYAAAKLPVAGRAIYAHLVIDQQSDIQGLAAYWGAGGREEEVAGLLDSARRIRGGSTIDIVHLLPGSVRSRLYCYPGKNANRGDTRPHGFQVVLDLPDDRLNEEGEQGDVARFVLASKYEPVAQPHEPGDVVMLVANDGRPVHVAAYLAGDIVFTHNGIGANEPWILMHLGDMFELYQARQPARCPLAAMFYRECRP